MNYLNNVWKLYLIRFFQSLIPAYVIERLFWEQRGMTIPLVIYTEIIYAITIVLLEIPTGMLADRWSRKNLIVIGAALGCLEFLILIYATEFWHFALVVVLAGIARSACSGSENALLYDSLKLHGQEASFEKRLGRLNALDFTAAMIAALSGSLLANRFGFELNYWLSFAGMVVAFCLSLTLVEPVVRTAADALMPIRQYVKEALLFFRHQPGVRLVVLSGLVAGASLSFVDEFWQLYLDRLDFPVMYFGLFSAAYMLSRVPGSLLAGALVNRFRCRTLLIAVLAVLAAAFFYLSVAAGYAGLGAILLIGLLSGVIEPVCAGYLHHRVDSAMRATMDSFQSLGQNAVLILTGIGFGYGAFRGDIFGGFGFIAVLCAVYLIYFAMSSKKTVDS